MACDERPPSPPSAAAAREFRAIGEVQLLPTGRAAAREEGPLVPDSKVRWTVRRSLADAGIGAEVTVERQVVTLRGTVPPAQVAAAEEIARGVHGVAAVKNELVAEAK